MKTLVLVLAATMLAACSDPQPASSTAASPDGVDDEAAVAGDREPAIDNPVADTAPATAPVATDASRTEADYLGRWTGVEGMVLVVTPKPGGGVSLEMQWDLDNKGTFEGSVTAEGLRFVRNGVAESAVHTDGDATGLKYLAGKQDCLTVKSGEGYCRD